MPASVNNAVALIFSGTLCDTQLAKPLAIIALKEITMIDQTFEPKLAAAMRFALDEVCRNLPARFNDHDCRSFVAAKIIERVRSGEKAREPRKRRAGSRR